MHRPVIALVAVGAVLWWMERKAKAAPVAVNGASSSNPSIAGGDSYGQLTTVDLAFRPDGSGADVVVNTKDLGSRLGPSSVSADEGFVLRDAVSLALAQPVALRPLQMTPAVRAEKLQPVMPSLSARPRYSL